MSPFRLRVAAALAMCAAAGSVLLGSAAGQQRLRLDEVLAAYAHGDHDVVARSFTRSDDFLKHNLFERRRVERWLGAWSPDKAALLAELISRASSVGPAYIPNLVTTGQRYVMGRPSPPGAVPREDDLERRWHLIVVGVLQRHVLPTHMLQYLDVLRARRPLPAAAAVWDARLELARGIGQEQLCRLMNATARQDRVLAELEGTAQTPLLQRQGAIDCMRAALTMLDAAAARQEVRDEAQIRRGFVAFQLGRNTEAKAQFDDVAAVRDRTLAYWRSLFSGRVADARGEDADAEMAYRAALALYPDAQSARVGLALALFRMHRSDEADEAMRAARRVSDDAMDPWEQYFTADSRFVEDWLVSIRKARQ